jgi:hypothetical protein
MRYLLISVLPCILIVAAVPALAATYKWVDETGQTVYSQTPPPPGTQGVERIKTPPRSAADTSSTSQKTKDDAVSFDERREQRQTAEQDQKKMRQAEVERKQHCEQMGEDIETLTTRPIVRRTPADGGEPVILSAEERESEVKELRERMTKECK